jgi:hypothetical protein
LSTHSGSCGQQTVRGYFNLGGWEERIHMTSSSDFLVYVWARNVGSTSDTIFITTPASQFRTRSSTGPSDGIGFIVEPQTGQDLGCIGGRAGETIDVSSDRGIRITIFVTLVTAKGATANMTVVERSM